MLLLFNMLSRLVIAFLPRSKGLLISWLQSPSAVILETKKIESFTVYIVPPSICHEVTGLDAMLIFWMLSFTPTYSLSSFTFIKRLFSSSLLSVTRVLSSLYTRLLIFFLAILIPACASSSPIFIYFCMYIQLSRHYLLKSYLYSTVLFWLFDQRSVDYVDLLLGFICVPLFCMSFH